MYVQLILGFTAIRHIERGTRYVQTVVKVFMENAHNSDIFTLLTKVYFFGVEFYFGIGLLPVEEEAIFPIPF